MVELDQFKYTLNTYEEPLKEVRDSLDLENKEQRVEELEREMEAPGFWDNAERSQKMMKELSALKGDMEIYHKLQNQKEEIELMIEMGYEENDASVIPDIQEMLDEFQRDFDHIRIKTLLSGEYDKDNAIVTLHAGAGGTESCDWASMLYRMYLRWADRQGFSTEVLDYLDGEEAGIKSVTFQVNGENAYGYLKSEKGVHRLVRISPFDANSRRHTSFSACDVMPEIDDDVEVDINMADVRVDTYRASGAGGQHINKTDSAVRMTHIPTGIVAQCQSERSQLQNREQCMRLLRARLFELEQEKKEKELAALEGDQQKIEWGSQIRSYVFHPYNLVKDHRTNTETSDTQGVMDGDINKFIESYLHAKANHII